MKCCEHCKGCRKKNGNLYVLGEELCSEYVKIGWTSHTTKSRVSALQCGNPRTLITLASMRANRCCEAYLHRRYDHLRVVGEWFCFDQEMRSDLALLFGTVI